MPYDLICQMAKSRKDIFRKVLAACFLSLTWNRWRQLVKKSRRWNCRRIEILFSKAKMHIFKTMASKKRQFNKENAKFQTKDSLFMHRIFIMLSNWLKDKFYETVMCSQQCWRIPLVQLWNIPVLRWSPISFMMIFSWSQQHRPIAVSATVSTEAWTRTILLFTSRSIHPLEVIELNWNP